LNAWNSIRYEHRRPIPIGATIGAGSSSVLAFPAGSDCASVPHTKTLSIAVENDLVIIPVRINGLTRTFRFVLDTGAEITMLDAQVSRAFGLPRGEDIDVLTVGAQGAVPTVRIQTDQFRSDRFQSPDTIWRVFLTAWIPK
jgi:Aspartyl protease